MDEQKVLDICIPIISKRITMIGNYDHIVERIEQWITFLLTAPPLYNMTKNYHRSVSEVVIF
jgi:hypothetical protein